jgi:hypothetical protein
VICVADLGQECAGEGPKATLKMMPNSRQPVNAWLDGAEDAALTPANAPANNVTALTTPNQRAVL